MAYRNQIIRNAQTGHEIVFLHPASCTNDRYLGLLVTFQPTTQPSWLRYHPKQAINLDVLTGELNVLLDKRLYSLKAGDQLQVAAGQPYALWNGAEHCTSINCRVFPALSTEQLLTTVTEWANARKSGKQPIHSLLQSALLLNKFSDVLRLPNWPFFVQKTVCWLLTPIAHLAGYKLVRNENDTRVAGSPTPVHHGLRSAVKD